VKNLKKNQNNNRLNFQMRFFIGLILMMGVTVYSLTIKDDCRIFEAGKSL